jgi:hypothetical protein
MADLSTRLLYPEDRTAFIYQDPGEPILTPYRTGLEVFEDEACTRRAEILDINGQVIPHSTIYTADDSLLPLFYGPLNNQTIVWVKVVGGNLNSYPLVAQYGAQLQLVPTLLMGQGPPPDELGVEGAAYIDRQTYTLYGPKGHSAWPRPGFTLQGPQGESGGSYEHQQITPSSVWVIDHALRFRPNVTTIDSAGYEMIGDISYPSPTRVVVEYSSPTGGTALLS